MAAIAAAVISGVLCVGATATATSVGFNVVNATSQDVTTVAVTFDALPNALEAADASNYAAPGLTLTDPVLSGNTVTLTTSAQAAQSYTVTVTGVTRASDATPLNVNTATFAPYAIQLDDTTYSATPGGSASIGVTILPVSGFTDDVHVCVQGGSGVPQGNAGSFPGDVTFTGADYSQQTLTLTVDGAVAPGSYGLWIADCDSHYPYTPFTLNVLSPAPQVTSFLPTSGVSGDSIDITGSHFTGATEVDFGGTPATTFTVNSDNDISATVPDGAVTGPIAVIGPGGEGDSVGDFTVNGGGGGGGAAPTVSSFSPTSGASGDSIDITGTSFTGATEVDFNGTPATAFTVNSDTDISATVPDGATTGPIAVIGPGGEGDSVDDFTISGGGGGGGGAAPTVSSFAPTKGTVGTSVDVTGTGFTGATEVDFGGMPSGDFTVNSDTELHATVPDGATTGPIAVVGPGGEGDSVSSFTVLPAVIGGAIETYAVSVDGGTDSLSGATPQPGNVGFDAYLENQSDQTVANAAISAQSSPHTFDPPVTFPYTTNGGDLLSSDQFDIGSIGYATPVTTGVDLVRSFQTIPCADAGGACVADPSTVTYPGGSCPSISVPGGASNGDSVPTGNSLEIVKVVLQPEAGAPATGEVDTTSLLDVGDNVSARLLGCSLGGVNSMLYDDADPDGASIGLTTTGSSTMYLVYQLANTNGSATQVKPEVTFDSLVASEGSVQTSTGTSATLASAALGGDVKYSSDTEVAWSLQNEKTVLISLGALTPSLLPPASDGSGTVDASPTSAVSGSTGNSLTFSYTADPDQGGLSNGTVTIDVPAGWDAPSTDPHANGYVTVDNPDATVSVGGTGNRQIQVSGLNLSAGDVVDITYGDTSGGGSGATAPASFGAQEWTTKEQSTADGTSTALAAQPSVVLTAADGLGTMTASPTAFHVGDTNKKIVFTYTAAAGGLSNGTVALVVPFDWTSPTKSAGAGHVSSSRGTVEIGDDGQTIYVTGLTMNEGQTVQITYAGASPAGSGPEDWEALEQFNDGDDTHATITDLAAFPSVNVVAAAGSGTMQPDTPSVPKGTTNLTLSFTYTADDGGLANGVVSMAVPAGWPAPVTGGPDSPNALKPGYTTYAGPIGSTMTINKQVITVSGLNMAGGDTFTIAYGDTSAGGPGATAPKKTGNANWTTAEQSLPGDKPTLLAVQPRVPVTGKPKVSGFAPATAALGATVTIKGSDLAGIDDPSSGGIAFVQLDPSDPTSVVAESDVDVTTAVVNAAGTAVTFPLPSDISDGQWQVQVTNDGGIGGDLTDGGTSPVSKAKLTVVDAPHVDSVSLADAAAGTAIALTGENLKGTTAVWFTGGPNGSPGISAKPAVKDNKNGTFTLTVKVPLGAITGSVWTVTNGATSNLSAFTVDYVTPSVKKITPALIAPTGTITIAGSHFTGVQDSANGGSVTIGGESVDPSQITWNSDKQLTVVVPEDVAAGSASVVVYNATGHSTPQSITIVKPTITGVAPTSTKAALPVTITGTSLTGAKLVTFAGGKTAVPKVAKDGNSMTVVVPKGAQSGAFTVTIAGVTISSGAVTLTITT